MEREEVTIGPPNGVLSPIRPFHKDHVDITLVRQPLVDTVYLTTSDVCWIGERERDGKLMGWRMEIENGWKDSR